jgi:hypothetical protein
MHHALENKASRTSRKLILTWTILGIIIVSSLVVLILPQTNVLFSPGQEIPSDKVEKIGLLIAFSLTLPLIGTIIALIIVIIIHNKMSHF